jgi:transcriptional regulator
VYNPPAFRETRPEELTAAMAAIGLATLVTRGSGGLVATHLPLLHDPEPAPCGRLLGHLARANPQWRELAPGEEALAVFLGPEAYVTPRWYPSKAEHGRVVPTWNYLAVHAWGRLRVETEPAALEALVRRLTERHEAGADIPWRVEDAPAAFLAGQLKGIVGIELTIARLEGKWKMSQNRPPADREGVIGGLERRGEAGDAAVAEVMRGHGARGRGC